MPQDKTVAHGRHWLIFEPAKNVDAPTILIPTPEEASEEEVRVTEGFLRALDEVYSSFIGLKGGTLTHDRLYKKTRRNPKEGVRNRERRGRIRCSQHSGHLTVDMRHANSFHCALVVCCHSSRNLI